MKFKIKSLTLGALFLSSVLLTGCQSEPSTLTFTPPAPKASMNVNQSAVVYVTTRDMRNAPEISSYVNQGQLFKLFASPEVTQLFQQVEQQDLVSKGFRIGMANNSNAAVTVDIQQFFAKVNQGNLRYDIDSKIQLAIHVQGRRGQFTKNINASRTHSGAFSAKNQEIQKVLGETFNEVVESIYKDQEISNAINQYAN
ncbi:YajG family lipoprotein [Aggregatibacter kilianii]|uniref:YajG family lipoprotein n=1 Tax=Aggregatibacter kilianii TaxID=2025884 RepID=UPI000D65EBCB|nr:YajG family lipoprotein [Aggregatibacter kilianii]